MAAFARLAASVFMWGLIFEVLDEFGVNTLGKFVIPFMVVVAWELPDDLW